METVRELVDKELKLRAILINIIRGLEEDKDRPWEYEAAKKRALMERKIRRLKAILAQLESIAPWTVLGGTTSGQTTQLSVRQKFIGKHYHFVEEPFLPYPSSDSSSSDGD